MIVPRSIRRLFPNSAKLLYHKLRYFLFYRGTARYCPVCDRSSSRFLAGPFKIANWARDDVKCPYCLSYERHRLVYLYLRKKTDLFSAPRERSFLHLAPEPCLRPIFRKLPRTLYRTADLSDPNADLKMDICNIDFPDDSFDIILCSHVLEHVPNDEKAMREFSRTLKPDGWAIFMVPVTVEKTFEDPTITDPRERERLFGPDHLRAYGPDFENRLRANGFNVTVTYGRDFLTPEEMKIMSILDTDQVYHCTTA